MTDIIFEHQDHWPVLSTVEDMYEGDFLIKCSLFEGGFINFGYWDKEMPQHLLSVEHRLESGKNLYRCVLNKIGLSKKDCILEIACGAGAGSQLILQEFAPKEYHGIDASNSQIARAKRLNDTNEGVSKSTASFQVSSAESLPFPSYFFEKIFSIEAAQHFRSVEHFIKEAYRTLKSQGTLAISTFFALSNSTSIEAMELIPTIQNKVDFLHPIITMQKLLQEAGFQDIKIESIGENVWYGFDSWIAQGEFKNSWDRNWYKGYKQGLFDYFIILAKKI